MTGHARYAMRTLYGPLVVIGAVGLEVANFLQRGMPWRGEGLWTVEWFAIGLFIIGPLCAAVAAVDASRLTQPGAIHRVLTIPRPHRLFVWAAAWCAGPVVVVHLLAITAALIVGGVTHPSVGWGGLAVAAALQCLGIVWYVALGSALGRLASPLAAGLLAGVTGFAAMLMLGESAHNNVFRLLQFGGATVSRLGLAQAGGFAAGQVVMLAGMTVLFLFLPIRKRGTLRVPTGIGVGVIVALVGMLIALPPVMPQVRYAERPFPPTRCSGSAPQICLYPEHRRFSAFMESEMRPLFEVASAHGYTALVPERVLESSRTYRPGGVGIRTFTPPDVLYKTGRMPVVDLAYSLIEPAHCEELRGAVPPRDEFYDRIFSVMETWLTLAQPGVERHIPGGARVTHLSPDQVRDVLDDFAHCDLYGTG